MIFNWEFYLLKNLDLNNFITEDEVLNHFYNFGIFEQRLYCDISIFFNWQVYARRINSKNKCLSRFSDGNESNGGFHKIY